VRISKSDTSIPADRARVIATASQDVRLRAGAAERAASAEEESELLFVRVALESLGGAEQLGQGEERRDRFLLDREERFRVRIAVAQGPLAQVVADPKEDRDS